ncbi:uncharacterized protein At5g01610-like [Primulina eburnea]|uniref:uncharacterized protein At5g01610-like n=1 Tax=Primulina eburnea TaxID=1245227 RepID=UPI003C6BFE56
MIPLRYFTVPLSTLFFICWFLSVATCNQISEDSSIYDILNLYGLPMGLFPKGVRNFNFDKSGKFQVYLDQACNAKFENELHYEMNVSGVLSYGQIDGLSGMTAQDLFLWFPVIEIRVDIPSSGLIYFDVGVVSKKFSLSLFETPRDCLAVLSSDLQNERNTMQTVSKILHKTELDQGNAFRAAL